MPDVDSAYIDCLSKEADVRTRGDELSYLEPEAEERAGQLCLAFEDDGDRDGANILELAALPIVKSMLQRYRARRDDKVKNA